MILKNLFDINNFDTSVMRLIIMITYVLLKIVLCNTFVLERLTICLPIRVLVSIRLLQW